MNVFEDFLYCWYSNSVCRCVFGDKVTSCTTLHLGLHDVSQGRRLTVSTEHCLNMSKQSGAIVGYLCDELRRTADTKARRWLAAAHLWNSLPSHVAASLHPLSS